MDDWLTYDLPPHLVGVAFHGKYRGQRQKWFALRFTGEDSDIDLHAHEPEFADWKWLAHGGAAAADRAVQARHLCQGDRRLPRIWRDADDRRRKPKAAGRDDPWRLLRALGVGRLCRNNSAPPAMRCRRPALRHHDGAKPPAGAGPRPASPIMPPIWKKCIDGAGRRRPSWSAIRMGGLAGADAGGAARDRCR